MHFTLWTPLVVSQIHAYGMPILHLNCLKKLYFLGSGTILRGVVADRGGVWPN